VLPASIAAAAPVGEGDLGVDQFLNVVLTFAAALVTGVLVIVFVVVVMPVPVFIVFIGRERAVRQLDVGECEKGLAACFSRCAPQ
jgi:hypothetical protein